MRAGPLLIVLILALAVGVGTAIGAPLTPKEELGKAIFFDKISSPDRMACAACHGPSVGFTGPNPGVNANGAVYPGAIHQRYGNRKPPSAAYATTAPIFHYDPVDETFVGGNFWDGRATGEHLGNPAADQALGPFLNPVEQNNPSPQAVLEQIASSQYAPLWEAVWGAPLTYMTDAEIETNYNRVGLSIAAYEASSEVNAFSSKYDYVMKGEATFTAKEQHGMELFEGKALCANCHPGPLFTDYTYDNLGIPANPFNPFYQEDMVYLDDGSPINPLGPMWVDTGLGGFLEMLPESYFTAIGLDKADAVEDNWGKHKVPTLRNVDKRPSEDYVKAYLHNGVFTSLRQVINFYNTRDVGKWAPPEVEENVNHEELGDLGLTRNEVSDLLEFLGTLSDGWIPEKKMVADGTPTTELLHLSIVGANPARSSDGSVRFAITLDKAASVDLAVFDVRGRLVRRLASGPHDAGQYEYRWNGTNASGGQASHGVYFAVVRSGDVKEVRRLVWMR